MYLKYGAWVVGMGQGKRKLRIYAESKQWGLVQRSSRLVNSIAAPYCSRTRAGEGRRAIHSGDTRWEKARATTGEGGGLL